jgi:hypothetical protein
MRGSTCIVRDIAGDGSTWHDYAGSAIRNDLRIDDEGAVTVLRSYFRAVTVRERKFTRYGRTAP